VDQETPPDSPATFGGQMLLLPQAKIFLLIPRVRIIP